MKNQTFYNQIGSCHTYNSCNFSWFSGKKVRISKHRCLSPGPPLQRCPPGRRSGGRPIGSAASAAGPGPVGLRRLGLWMQPLTTWKMGWLEICWNTTTLRITGPCSLEGFGGVFGSVLGSPNHQELEIPWKLGKVVSFWVGFGGLFLGTILGGCLEICWNPKSLQRDLLNGPRTNLSI